MKLTDITEHLRLVLLQHSERLAAVDKDRSITYRELDQLSDDLALRLLSVGTFPGDQVILAIDRSIYALIGIVATMKAGLVYVPQEFDGRDKHVFDHIHGSKQSLFLTRLSLRAGIERPGCQVIVIDEPSTSTATLQSLPTTLTANDPIYTIYTSGSTGVAKGVNISRSNVLHYQQALSHLLEINKPLSYAYVSSLSADLGNTCVFLSLLSGGTLHFVDDETRCNAAQFQGYLAEHRIDVLKITPSHFVSLCNTFHIAFKLKWLIFGGEALTADLVRSVLLRGQALHVANHYGPTETTIGVACYPMRTLENVPASGSVPVGLPLGDTMFELVDEHGTILTGLNVQGELRIGGPSVGLGYCNDPVLTKKKFAPLVNRRDDGRFYSTGDLFLRNNHGVYVFVGRKDRQVKVRGYRVDLEAIETMILQYCDVSAAVVLAQQAHNGLHSQLVAAIVPDNCLQSSSETLLNEIHKTLRRVLLKHQVPSRILLLDTMPITSNGKADIKTIKARIDKSPSRTSSAPDLASPDTEPRLVALACRAWIRCVGIPPASLDDNFYDAGGDSILAIQLISALQREDICLSHTIFYETPTFGGLLTSLSSRHAKTAKESTETSERHLAPIQRWFFEMFPDGPDYWAQIILIDCEKSLDQLLMHEAVDRLLHFYPILSTAFTREADEWIASDVAVNAASTFKVRHLCPDDSVSEVIQEATSELQLQTGQLFCVLLLHQQAQPDRLAVICHHLVVDGISWRILLDDLARLYSSLLQGKACTLDNDPCSRYWSWTKRLKEWGKALRAGPTIVPEIKAEGSSQLLPIDFNTGPNDEGSSAMCGLAYTESSTYTLLHDLTRHLGIPIQNTLLASFVRGVAHTFFCGKTNISVDIETHGRHLFPQEIDINRAVGWFTALSTCMLDVKEHEPLRISAERIQHRLEGLPHNGVEHGVRRYFTQAHVDPLLAPELCFNYLGHFTLDSDPRLAWSWSNEYPGLARAASSSRIYKLKLASRVLNGQLTIDLSYSTHLHTRSSIEKLLTFMMQDLSNALAEVDPIIANKLPQRYFANISNSGLLTYVPNALRQDMTRSAASRPQVVLLTGATGYIGIYLLRELLAQKNLQVHCLVRQRGEKSAEARLWEQFHWYFPNDLTGDTRRRVVVHEGDITAENLGLNPQSYAALASFVDTVFHSAADVRLFAPLDELRRTNVQGTRHAIEFCQRGAPKQLHFVSTLSVAGVCSTQGGSVFSEDDLHCGQSFLTPYEQSKYEAEAVVRQFTASSSRACIYRTGSVSADATGTFQMNIDSNRVMQSICTYVLSGMVPSREEDLLLCPVDSLVRALVSIAMSTLTPTGTFHLTPPRPYFHDELVPVLRKLGFNVRLETREAYLEALKSLESSHPREAMLGRLWAGRASRGGIRIDAKRTQEYLEKLGTAIPPIDDHWFKRFLSRCVARGYLPNAKEFTSLT